MEKLKAHYVLDEVKLRLQAGMYVMTETAKQTALHDFNLFEPDIIARLVMLEQKDFYKAMTCYRDAHEWQDVYRPVCNGVQAYVKLNIFDDEVVIISFKKR